MTLYKAFLIPALLLSGVCNSYAGEADNNITHEYMTRWNEAMNGQDVAYLPTTGIDYGVLKACKTAAPQQFRAQILNQWQHKTGSKMTQNAFLSEDLQLFDRLAATSCIEGAQYEHQGNGNRLALALSAMLLEMETKQGSDAYEQIKTMEFEAGMVTAKYGSNMEKKSINKGHTL